MIGKNLYLLDITFAKSMILRTIFCIILCINIKTNKDDINEKECRIVINLYKLDRGYINDWEMNGGTNRNCHLITITRKLL